jgi:hypothetical protein
VADYQDFVVFIIFILIVSIWLYVIFVVFPYLILGSPSPIHQIHTTLKIKSLLHIFSHKLSSLFIHPHFILFIILLLISLIPPIYNPILPQQPIILQSLPFHLIVNIP